jgi:hypothetical protein
VFILLIFMWLVLDIALVFPQEFSTKNKLLITGTPLQNSVEELWYGIFLFILVRTFHLFAC